MMGPGLLEVVKNADTFSRFNAHYKCDIRTIIENGQEKCRSYSAFAIEKVIAQNSTTGSS